MATITFVGSAFNSGGGSSLNIGATGRVAGDICVILDQCINADGSGSIPASVTPSGFTQIGTTKTNTDGANFGARSNAWFKVLAGTETTLTMMSGTAENDSAAMVFRPSAGTWQTPGGIVSTLQVTGGLTTGQTVVVGTAPLFLIGSNLSWNDTDDLVMTPAYDGHVYNGLSLSMGYKIYNSAAANNVISGDAACAGQVGFYIALVSSGSVGSASGSGAAAGTGRATTNGVGSSAGTGAAAGVGKSIFNGVGAASGAGSAVATGKAVLSAVGSASGVGTAAGIGAPLFNGVGSAAGAGSAAGIGAPLALSVGAASGAGTANGVSSGGSIVSAVGAATGSGTANGVSNAPPAAPNPLPQYDFFAAIQAAAPGVVIQREDIDAVSAAWIANNYSPLSTAQIVALVGPLPAAPAKLPRFPNSNSSPDNWSIVQIDTTVRGGQ